MAVDLAAYAPFDSGPGANNTESNWRNIFQFVHGANNARSGVRRNVGDEHSVYADSTGLWVKVKSGNDWIEGHWGASVSDTIVPVTPNSTGATRMDRVVVRANYVTNKLEFDCVAGSSTTTPPARTNNANQYEFSLAAVAVPNGASTIAATAVYDGRDYLDHPDAYFRCTSDTTVNNSSTLVDVTGMSITGASNATYIFDGYIDYSASSTADMKCRLVTPSGAVGRMSTRSMDFFFAGAGTIAGQEFNTNTTNIDYGLGGVGVSTRLNANLKGWIVMPDVCGTAAAPMTIKLQIAQSTAEASNATVFQNSWVRLSRSA